MREKGGEGRKMGGGGEGRSGPAGEGNGGAEGSGGRPRCLSGTPAAVARWRRGGGERRCGGGGASEGRGLFTGSRKEPRRCGGG